MQKALRQLPYSMSLLYTVCRIARAQNIYKPVETKLRNCIDAIVISEQSSCGYKYNGKAARPTKRK